MSIRRVPPLPRDSPPPLRITPRHTHPLLESRSLSTFPPFSSSTAHHTRRDTSPPLGSPSSTRNLPRLGPPLSFHLLTLTFALLDTQLPERPDICIVISIRISTPQRVLLPLERCALIPNPPCIPSSQILLKSICITLLSLSLSCLVFPVLLSPYHLIQSLSPFPPTLPVVVRVFKNRLCNANYHRLVPGSTASLQATSLPLSASSLTESSPDVADLIWIWSRKLQYHRDLALAHLGCVQRAHVSSAHLHCGLVFLRHVIRVRTSSNRLLAGRPSTIPLDNTLVDAARLYLVPP
ncbi:hypothetical protein B0H19DRAFT_1381118 [Mycena capillaripes]|nr:hypothetical protein B0H19DRAFT_1381118 [Mycena capillaripes]